MTAEVTSFELWSATPGSNQPDDTDSAANLAENLRTIQAEVKEWLASSGTIASAGTTNLASVGAKFIVVTGTTTITALGTLADGIEKVLIFADTLTLTYDPSALILPTSADITTVAGDVAYFVSLGSGNWRCTSYTRRSGQQTAGNTTFGDGTEGAPAIAFTADTNTGIYRSTTDVLGFAAGGTTPLKLAKVAANAQADMYVDLDLQGSYDILGVVDLTISGNLATGSGNITTSAVTGTTGTFANFVQTSGSYKSGTGYNLNLTPASGQNIVADIIGTSLADDGYGIQFYTQPAGLSWYPTGHSLSGDFGNFAALTHSGVASGQSIVVSENNVVARTTAMSTTIPAFEIHTASEGTDSNYLFKITSSKDSTPNVRFYVRGDGATFADGAYTGTGADYAEWFDYVGEKPEGGQSVALVGDAVKVAEEGDEVIGVISIKPAVVGDYQEGKEDRVIVGLVGKLKVRKGCPVDSRWRLMKEGDEFDLYLVR